MRKRLAYQLALVSALILIVLFAFQVVLGLSVLRILQDRSDEQLLRPQADEVSQLLATHIQEGKSLRELDRTLYGRFRWEKEISLFVFDPAGMILADLSFSTALSPLDIQKILPPAEKVREKLENFWNLSANSRWPFYLPDPHHPGAHVAFASAPIRVGEKQFGWVVLTPRAGFKSALLSLSWDGTGVAMAIATLLLTIYAAGLLGWLAFRKTASRFAKVADSLTSVAKGELKNISLPENSEDEIGTISKAVNNLAKALARKQEENRLILSSLTHDLHSPIATIQAYAEHLQETGSSVSPEEAAIVIAQRAKSATKMLSELLQLAELSAQEDEAFRLVDLNDLVDEAMLGLKFQAKEARIELIQEFAVPQAQVLAQGDKLSRVLANLMENALRHSPAGSALRAGVREEKDAFLVFVRDEGEGIPQNELASLQQPFQQGKHHSRARKGLSGLGLSICREILQRHQSRLDIESSEGKGSTFSFALRKASANPLSQVK